MAVNPFPGDAIFRNPSGVFSAGNPAFVITATSSGTAHTLLTAVSTLNDVDLVTLWAWNNTGTNRLLTLEIGGVTMGGIYVMRNGLPAKVLERFPMNNSITLKAFADVTAVVGVGISTVRLIDQAQ